MATAIKNGALVTCGDTSDKEYVFNGPVFSNLLAIEVVSSSGGIQFSVGEPVDTGNSLYTTGAKLLMTVGPNYNLHAKGSSGADTFRVTR